jgi:hypothetical protein
MLLKVNELAIGSQGAAPQHASQEPLFGQKMVSRASASQGTKPPKLADLENPPVSPGVVRQS